MTQEIPRVEEIKKIFSQHKTNLLEEEEPRTAIEKATLGDLSVEYSLSEFDDDDSYLNVTVSNNTSNKKLKRARAYINALLDYAIEGKLDLNSVSFVL